MTRPITPSGSIVVRVVGALLTIVFATAVLLALFALTSCEGEPPHCPPPIGCAR